MKVMIKYSVNVTQKWPKLQNILLMEALTSGVQDIYSGEKHPVNRKLCFFFILAAAAAAVATWLKTKVEEEMVS